MQRLSIAFDFCHLNCACLSKTAIEACATVNRGRGLSRGLFHPILNRWMICSLRVPLFSLTLVGWILLSMPGGGLGAEWSGETPDLTLQHQRR